MSMKKIELEKSADIIDEETALEVATVSLHMLDIRTHLKVLNRPTDQTIVVMEMIADGLPEASASLTIKVDKIILHNLHNLPELHMAICQMKVDVSAGILIIATEPQIVLTYTHQ